MSAAAKTESLTPHLPTTAAAPARVLADRASPSQWYVVLEIFIFKQREQHSMPTTGIYWGLSALALLGALDQVDRSQAIQEVNACYHPESGMLSLSLSL